MWVEQLFKALGEAIGLVKQSMDPEVIRLFTLREIESKLVHERKKRDDLLAVKITEENEVDTAIALGAVIDNILNLLHQKDRIKK